MHTLLVLALGFAVLGVCTFVGRALAGRPGMATGALVFLAVWLVGAGLNLVLGVVRAGYPIAAEVPVFLVVFAIPSGAALFAARRLRRGEKARVP